MAKISKAKAKRPQLNGPKKRGIEKKINKKRNKKVERQIKPNQDGKIKSTKKPRAIDTETLTVIKKKPSKSDLKQVIEALKHDPSLLLVRKALKYIPAYLKSEGLTKKFTKEIIKLWSEGGEKIRIVCLLCLIRIYTKLEDQEKRQLIVKQLYNTFLEKCRITKHETMSMIGFMRHSLIELYKLDSKVAFKQAQASSQQLTTTLKNAITHKNEETHKTVLNWQFANCLILLSSLITSQQDDSPIKSLTHQVIQLNLGALDIIISPRYYSFYCHLIENLINLSKFTGLFIPIMPLLMRLIDRIQLAKSSKSKKSEDTEDPEETKKYNINLLNHVSAEEVTNKEYLVAVLDKIYELMLLYLASQCHKIAFPELVLLPSVQLKKWIKKSSFVPQAQKFKALLENVKSDSTKLEEARKSISFSFTNYAAVDAWEKKMRDSNKLQLPKMSLNTEDFENGKSKKDQQPEASSSDQEDDQDDDQD